MITLSNNGGKSMAKRKKPDQRKARAEANNGKIPNPGQTVNDNSGSHNVP